MEENIPNWKEFYDILKDACRSNVTSTQESVYQGKRKDGMTSHNWCTGIKIDTDVTGIKIDTEATKEQYKSGKETEKSFCTRKSEQSNCSAEKVNKASLVNEKHGKSNCDGKQRCGDQQSPSPEDTSGGCKMKPNYKESLSMKKGGNAKSRGDIPNEQSFKEKGCTEYIQKNGFQNCTRNNKHKTKGNRHSKNKDNTVNSSRHGNAYESFVDANYSYYMETCSLKFTAFMSSLKDFSNICASKFKDVVIFFSCFLLIIGGTAARFCWYFTVFLLKLLVFLGVWTVCKVISVAVNLNMNHNIIGILRQYLIHGNDLFFLITGVNIKGILSRSKKGERIEGDDNVGDLPSLPEEAVYHLMRHSDDNPFRTLCVSRQATNEEIKANYRKLVLLVHPDKCLLPEADAAFIVLDSAFKALTDPVCREKLLEEERERKRWEEFSKNYAEYSEMVKDLMNSISCSNCHGTHKRTLVKGRTSMDARFCGSCNCRHSAKDGDVWAENNMFGLHWTCYVCMDGQVYELTEWAECQNLRQTIPTNCHRIFCRLGSKQTTNSRGRRHKENEHSDVKKSRKKRRHQGRKT